MSQMRNHSSQFYCCQHDSCVFCFKYPQRHLEEVSQKKWGLP